MSKKATAVLRRSTVRLRSSFGSGHTSLNLFISEQSSVRQKYKDLLAAQTSAAQILQKWSQTEECPALQDILHMVYELNLMWTDAQRDFIVALKEYKRVYEQVLEMEKKLDHAKKQLAMLEEKERKLQKDLVKGPKEPALTQEKLRQVTDSKNLASAEVTGQQSETEAIKMLSIKAGLLDMSRAWSTLGKKCTTIAESQRELAGLIPDVATRVQELPTYTGSRESTRILYSCRSQLEQLEPPEYGSSAASYPHPSSRPSSAKRPSTDHSLANRRLSEPSGTALKRPPHLTYSEQDYDSFDSFESD